MAAPKWFCIAIMAVLLSLAVCTAHRNLPGTQADNPKLKTHPIWGIDAPDFYLNRHNTNFGGGVGGGGGFTDSGCGDCRCGVPNEGGGGGCGSGDGCDINPPQFTIPGFPNFPGFPIPVFTIPGFPPLNEPYQCCPSNCGYSPDCPRFTLHLTHNKPNAGGSKFPIPGFRPIPGTPHIPGIFPPPNGPYQCRPSSCAYDPHDCPGFTMYLNHNKPNVGVPMHNNEGEHDATQPEMSTIDAMAPVKG
ncbi:Uncharacterized protein Fot_45489 [Forsythia ovata]|uniref:Uncharacterized protein n=1 Tax=Forsythia ovata TaxID=205694 RepID=A0ABD1R6K1_9LAMI